jgi:metal-sulfur cluster biosynthetic enzyme
MSRHHSSMSQTTSLRDAVVAALGSVTDPELDQSLVELGFARAEVEEQGHVRVEVRLPTFWCAPNFAYLMARDARDAVAGVPGVRSVSVRLLDHFAGREIGSSVTEGRSFDDAFEELADGGGLDALRRLFEVKAFSVRQERLLRRLLSEGRTESEVVSMTLGDVGRGGSDVEAYLEKRARLGLPVDPAARLAVMPNGRPIAAGELLRYLNRSRLTRVSIEANTTLCRSMHVARYSDGVEVER